MSGATGDYAELREALVGLLWAVEKDLQWDTEQPYRALVHLHMRRAKEALGQDIPASIQEPTRSTSDA